VLTNKHTHKPDITENNPPRYATAARVVNICISEYI